MPLGAAEREDGDIEEQKEEKDEEEEEGEAYVPTGYSLFVFGPDSSVRRACLAAVESRSFQCFLLTVICLYLVCFVLRVSDNCVHYELIRGKGCTHPDIMRHVRRLEATLVGVFVLEFLLKIIAYGFLCGKQAYIKQPWNGLDFAILIMCSVQFYYETTQHIPGREGGYQGFSLGVFRTLRVMAVLEPCLRPLKHCLRVGCNMLAAARMRPGT